MQANGVRSVQSGVLWGILVERMISIETHFLILSTDPHEVDGVEGTFVVLVASSPSALTNPDEPDGVAAKT